MPLKNVSPVSRFFTSWVNLQLCLYGHSVVQITVTSGSRNVLTLLLVLEILRVQYAPTCSSMLHRCLLHDKSA